MKRQSFNPLCAALLCASFLASCQDYSPSDELIIRQKATTVNYEKAFHQAFPVIDPEQNWGFGPMPICGADVDITRGMNTNSNEWESVYHYEVPGGLTNPKNPVWGWAAGDISNYERAYVYWWFSTHQWPQPIEVRWSEFFVENVWGQPEHSNETGDPTGSHYGAAISRWGMDNMHILDIDKIPANSPYDHKIKNEADALTHGVDQVSSDYEHVNDFNSAGGMLEQVMYAFDVSSEDWFYKESSGGSLSYHNNWTIQYINGNYYLGFDYWHQKKNDQGYTSDNYGFVKPDGYYNDWIIKLSSGKHVVDSYTRRIMCEDLGNTFDWDFNDLVFDVTIYNGDYGNGGSGYYAQITLQAAGGTLPIYIGQKDQAHEAHYLFGVPTTTPVNVDAVGGVNRPAVVFHLPLDNTYEISEQTIDGKPVLSFDPNQIPIYVTRSDMPDPATAVKLTAVKGQAPQKFACPCDTYWMKEFQNIEGIEGKQAAGHPNFVAWVAGSITKEAKVDANDTDEVAFVTERSPQSDKNFTVLYADANGSPFSVSFSKDGNVGTIQPWKDLWNSTKTDPLNSQFTEVRSYPKHVTNDGSDDIDNNDYTTYSTTFEAQAPYIYETVGADDDPIAYSAEKMKAVLDGNYANHEVVWSPNAKTVTLESNDASKGYVLGSGYYTGGKNVTITAVSRRYHQFVKWIDLDNGEATVSTDATYTIPAIDANKRYRAVFDEKEGKHVYFKSDPVGAGFIKNYPESGQADEWYDLGIYKRVNDFVAESREGWAFAYWNEDTSEDWELIEVDVEDKDVYITAHFRPVNVYHVTLQANNDAYGTVSGGGDHFENTLFTINATPKNGYRFVEWTDAEGEFKFPFASWPIRPEQDFGSDFNITLIAVFESVVSYNQGSAVYPNSNYPNYLATITPWDNNELNLTNLVNGLSNYTKCCIEITYSGHPGVNIGQDPWYFTLDDSQNITTRSYEIDFGNSLKIGGSISKIIIWVQ